MRINKPGQQGHSVDGYLLGVLRYADIPLSDPYNFIIFHQNRRMLQNPTVTGNDRAIDKSNRHYFLLKGSGFKGSGVQGFKGSRVQRFKGSGFKGSKVQGSRVQRFRVQRFYVQVKLFAGYCGKIGRIVNRFLFSIDTRRKSVA
jgi:hypothetical protein